MKKLLILSLLVCSILSVCCAAPAPTPPASPKRELQNLDLVLHVDTEFSDKGRALIAKAAENIRALTSNRANVTVVFDLDFTSISNLEGHRRAKHSVVIGVTSDLEVVDRIDASVGGKGGIPLAATTTLDDGSKAVFLILDRIEVTHFEAIVTHEFGHVIGLPDLAIMGAIMSGRQSLIAPPPEGWAYEDVELCRSYRFCE